MPRAFAAAPVLGAMFTALVAHCKAKPASCDVVAGTRTVAVACPTSRPPGNVSMPEAGPLSAGACNSDADCVNGGVNGRCTSIRPGSAGRCTYDACFSDGDCPSGSDCACDAAGGNLCVPSNCRVDSDCACGGCAPSPGNLTVCIPYFGSGVGGYDCRTPDDECQDSSDCRGVDGACAYNPEVGHWTCFSIGCAG